MTENDENCAVSDYVELCTCVHYSLCVECWDADYQISIHGIADIQDFMHYHNSESTIVNYYACTIPFVRLPVHKILQTFPSVKLINWACTAECYVTSNDLKFKFVDVYQVNNR